MTPVDQRIYASHARGDGHNGLGIAGDCFRACVASILDLDYADVPHVVHVNDGSVASDPNADADDPLTEEHGALWWRRIRRWLRDRGLDIACWEWEQPDNDTGYLELQRGDDPWRGDVILGGRSPRGPFKHVVVGRYFWDIGPQVRVTHDPHPSRDGLATIEDVTLIMDPYDPPPPDEQPPW